MVLHPTYSPMPPHIQMILGNFPLSLQTHQHWCFHPPPSVLLVHSNLEMQIDTQTWVVYLLKTSLPRLVTDFGLNISCGWSSTTKVPAPFWSLWLSTTNCDWEVYSIHSFKWVIDYISLCGDHRPELGHPWRPLVYNLAIPLLVVETTCALQTILLFLTLICPTLDFNMAFMLSLTYFSPSSRLSFI